MPRTPLILKIINYLLILAAVGLFVWLLNVNFPRSRQLDIKAEFNKDLPMLSHLGPEGRVILSPDTAVIVDSPAYFDLRVLPWFLQARVKITYQALGRQLEGIGPQAGSGWSFSVSKPLSVSEEPNGDKTEIYDFDLARAYDVKNVIRFIVSSKATGESGGEIIVRSLLITLKR